MKLDFNSFPLNIYNEVKAQSLLESVNFEMAKSRSGRFDAVQFIGSSVVKKLCGGSFAFLLENLSMWYNEAKARRCLSKLIDEQVNRVKCDSSVLLEMAQANLMISYCVTDYLNGLVSSSCGNAVKSCGKVIAGLFKRKDPRDVIWNSILVETKKWYDICQCYHIAFLLNVYNSIPDSEAEIRSLITESFRSNICEENVPLFSSKERPILFSNIQYKSLSENLEKRIGVLAAGITKELYDDLYEPFIKECIKNTETAGALVNVVENEVENTEDLFNQVVKTFSGLSSYSRWRGKLYAIGCSSELGGTLCSCIDNPFLKYRVNSVFDSTKLENAKESMGITKNEICLVQGDSTILGGGREGFVCTDKGVYLKIDSARPQFIKWGNDVTFHVRDNGFFVRRAGNVCGSADFRWPSFRLHELVTVLTKVCAWITENRPTQ